MRTCFVVMGFGKKTDFASGRTLDLDKTYQNIVKPALTEAGYDCVRADELLHSGVIDVPMYERLFSADLVVADLSTSNLNAAFELGVRHALKPRSTIIIAESQFSSPFDVNHILVNRYEHLGIDIGYTEAMRMRKRLTELAATLAQYAPVDSPVYAMIPDLEEPKLRNPATKAKMEEMPTGDERTYGKLWEQALAAKTKGDFASAAVILRLIYNEQTGAEKSPRPRVIQELGLAIYKAGEAKLQTDGQEVAERAYNESVNLLEQLNPQTTNDPETLGIWSAVHKRRFDLKTRSEAARRADLDVAILAAERGFLIRADYYTGTNLAYLLNVRASISTGENRIADNVVARRVRRRVIEICFARLAEIGTETSGNPVVTTSTLTAEKYWVEASMAEARIGLGIECALDPVLANAPAQWMADATSRQISRLVQILSEAQTH